MIGAGGDAKTIAEQPVLQLAGNHRGITTGTEGVDHFRCGDPLDRLLDRRQVKRAMQQKQRVLRLGDDVLGDVTGLAALRLRLQVAHADIGGAGKLHLEIGEAVAAEPSTEAGDGGRRHVRLARQFDDGGVHRKLEIIQENVGNAVFRLGEPPFFFL
ncbi:hypothetical protein D9M68_837170 [compost metagenome]